MAVDATYMNNLLPSQLLTSREIMKPSINHHHHHHHHHQQQQQQSQLLNSAVYNAMNNSAMPNQPTTITTAALLMPNQQSLMPFFQSNNVCDPNKAESDITYHHHHQHQHQHHIPLQRKRSRDFSTTELFPCQQKSKLSPQQQFINQDFLFQLKNQTQSEMDCVLAHHTEKVRMELEEQKLRQSRLLLNLLQETMVKKLKEKDEEIQRMEKLNIVLQERVKSLCVENQVWRELAQTNESTANYLRNNLEQVLAHDNNGGAAVAVPADDAASCCGSNDAAAAAAEEEAGEDTAATRAIRGGGCGGEGGIRMCKSCGVRESIVLLLPCRHLCLCAMCGSSVRNCPVCDSGMDASVHVNLS